MQGISLVEAAESNFVISIEVLPPRSHDITKILDAFSDLRPGMAQFLNVADSPMARPRLSSTVLAGLLQARMGLDAIAHLTVRDRNRVALESEILGAKALGVTQHLAVSGDSITFCDRQGARAAGDLAVPDLIHLCRDLGQYVGSVFDVDRSMRRRELQKLEVKLRAGAQFVITQPVYDGGEMRALANDVTSFGVPTLVGILPLYSERHASFLHHNVPGITISESTRDRIASSPEPVREGVCIAQELLQEAVEYFHGACLMPPFGHYELAAEILGRD